MTFKASKHINHYLGLWIGFLMFFLLLNFSLANAADLPPSPDDVAAFKKELKNAQIKEQDKNQAKDLEKALKPSSAASVDKGQVQSDKEKNQASKEDSVSSPSDGSAKNDAIPLEVASDLEPDKALLGEKPVTEESKINALGNVVSSEDESFSRKIKEWSKKLGEFYHTFEEYMGWDETTRLRKLDEGCNRNEALSCYELGETRHREGKTFEAETWYQLACGLMHTPSCSRYKKLAFKRESYEEKLRQDRFEIETLCESGRAASCAKAAYIAKYFGEKSVAEALNLKSCDLGYPAGCLQMARIEGEKGNVESASVFEKRGRDLLRSH